MGALGQPLFGVACLLLGIGLNEWIRRSNRIEAYAGAVFKERFDVYVKLWEIIRDAKPRADGIIKDSALSADARRECISELVWQVVNFCDEKSLYLNDEVIVHCCTVFMGVEDIPAEPDAKKRDEMVAQFEKGFQKVKEIVRAETGLTRMDGVFRQVTKARYSSEVIEYFRKLHKERRTRNR